MDPTSLHLEATRFVWIGQESRVPTWSGNQGSQETFFTRENHSDQKWDPGVHTKNVGFRFERTQRRNLFHQEKGERFMWNSPGNENSSRGGGLIGMQLTQSTNK